MHFPKALAIMSAACLVPALHAQSARQLELGAPVEFSAMEFSRIVDARELSDGRLVVSDGIDKQVYLVDFARRAAKKVGRLGSGPGEYRSPSRLLPLAADSTLLVDFGTGRWLVMARDSFVAVVTNNEPAMAAGANPLGADAHGHLLANKPARSLTQRMNSMSGTLNVTNDSSFVVRVDRASGRLDTVTVYRTRPARIVVQRSGDNINSVRITMNPVSTGEQPVLFADGAIAIARLDPYRVDWVIGGKTIHGQPLPFEAIPLTREEKVAALARQPRDDDAAPPDPDGIGDWPETVPPFLANAVLTAPDGRLWIRRAPSLEAPGTDYDVVDRAGRLAGRLHLPVNENIVTIGKGGLYVVMKDQDDLQHLRRYPLPK